MPSDNTEKFRAELLEWADENLRSFPWRETDSSFYEVFIAEFFLTQTPAENVAQIYPTFIDRYPSLKAIEQADRETLEDEIQPLGFHQMRARALSKIANKWDELPKNVDELENLPHVGPYVANATICFALERPLPVLERNVVRIYQRVFGDEFPAEEPDRYDFAMEMLPECGTKAREFNFALIDFGALVCEKRTPHCTKCFASDYCVYFTDQRKE